MNILLKMKTSKHFYVNFVPDKKSTGNRKRKAETLEEDQNANGKDLEHNKDLRDDVPVPNKRKLKAETKAKAPAATKLNKFLTDFTNIKFNAPEKDWNFKISSWNVAGLRALVQKGGIEYVEHEKPDIFCMQVSCLCYKIKQFRLSKLVRK